MSEWSLRLQTPTSQLTAQLPHGATVKVLREHLSVPLGPAAADAVLHDVRERQLPGGGGAGGDGRSADDRPPRPVSEDSFL